MEPRISVIMLTFRRPQFIGRAIESVRAQLREDWELIAVQDGDHEPTTALLAGWARRDKRVRHFRRDKPGNIAEATNFALHRARGEYIAILDDDDYWAVPDKLDRQVAFLDRNPGYAACGGGAIVVDLEGRERLRYLKPETDAASGRPALNQNPIFPSCGFYRREAALAAGGYDESLAGFQDWDFWLRLGRTAKLYNLPDYLVYYQLWEGGGSFFAQRANTESALRIVRRHRRAYPGFAPAFAMALLYYFFARLPLPVRRFAYDPLSRLKKALFADRR
ncbi:MAG: glycosyltransferase [Bryobacteraceae bacterium]|nr:glycosyltransferase [Bryobacteraceae bacterium]